MIEPERVTELNAAPEQPGDYVLYGMQNSQRAEFDPALEAAIAEDVSSCRLTIIGVGTGRLDTGAVPQVPFR